MSTSYLSCIRHNRSHCIVPQVTRWLVAVPLIFAATSGAAQEVRCVDTVAELDNAARIAIDDPVVIHLVQGTYDIDSTILVGFGDLGSPADPDDDITIIGGYVPGCGSRILEPFNTVLTSDDDNWLTIFGGDDSGNVRLESLTLRDLPSFIRLGGPFNSGYRVDLSRVALIRSPMRAAATYSSISQSLILDAPSVSQFRHCAFIADDMETVYVVHSVFHGNAGRGLCTEEIEPEGGWRLTATSNIFWNNGSYDIYTRSPDDESDVRLYNNIIETRSVVPASTSAPVASLNQNPLFGNVAATNFRLLGASPAINSGAILGALISQDIDGGPRQVGTRPDRGAYESLIDDTIVITVTNTTDVVATPLSGSLRWAINEANDDPGTNYIRFDIDGACPRIINLNAPLPDITERLVIEGYSQPGSEANDSETAFNATICIGVRGDLSDNHALQMPIGVGASHSLQISGIGFGGFDVAAIRIAGGEGSWIHGNQFAGALGSASLGNSAVNIRIGGTSSENLVGGDAPAERNVIGEAYVAGVQLLTNSAGSDGHDNRVQNNLIGTTRSGLSAAPNQIGVYVATADNEIRDNVISANSEHGILIEGSSASSNSILNNRIGLTIPQLSICFPPPCAPVDDLGNISMGILVQGGANDNRITGNRIAYNGGKGVRLFEGQRNRLLTNTIYANGALGIDTGSAGVNALDNDAAAGAAGEANRGLNWPFLQKASGAAHDGLVRGVLLSTNGNYILQVFSDTSCDALDHGEARVYHASGFATISNAPANANGNVSFSLPIEYTGNLIGRAISVTAMDAQGNSSEFSNCESYDLCDQIFAHDFDGATALSCTP